MKQSELIEVMRGRAADTGIRLNKEQAKALLGQLAGIVKEALETGETVKFPGLATFSRVPKAAREARNPRTGEAVTIPPHMAVKVVVADSLKKVLS